MYCMKCGGEVPDDVEACPACGAAAPRRAAPPAAPAFQQSPYQPQGYAPYPPYPQQPGYPPYPQQAYPQQPGYPPYPQQAYPQQPYQGQPGYPPYPQQAYPQQPGYQGGWASAPRPYYVVARAVSPLPAKPPLRQRMGERWKVYAGQARENRLETGLSCAAAGAVVLGVLAMMLTSL